MKQFYLSLLLAISSALTVHPTSKTYYITPSSDPKTCQSYPLRSCFTLDNLSNHLNLPQETHLTLRFLPGEHSLHHRITLSNCSAVSFDTSHGLRGRGKINCNGRNFTGFNLNSINTFFLRGLSFEGCRNIGTNGGAFSIVNVKSVDIIDCSFNSNQAFEASGGALYLERTSTIHIHNSVFTDNSVNCSGFCILEGGAVYIVRQSNIVISSSTFERNTVTGNGGAISSQMLWQLPYHRGGYQSLKLTDTHFVNNTAINKKKISVHTINMNAGTGGAVSKTGPKNARLLVEKSVFLSNCADTNGGAVYYQVGGVNGKNNLFISENCTYANNKAQSGGALYLDRPISFSTKHNLFQSNSALNAGGAVYVLFGFRGISEADSFITNNCLQYGGAAFLKYPNVFNITMGSFQLNSAEKGAGIFVYQDEITENGVVVEIKNTNFTRNQHTGENAGTVHIALNTVLQIKGGVIFSNNQGALYTSNSQITFQGDTLLQNNTASQQGGAITCVQSTLTFEEKYTTRIIGNRASYGGGMSLHQCTVNMVGNMVIDSNWADFSGGGIYSIQSTIKVQGRTVHLSNKMCTTNNIAHRNGGGMSLIASSFVILRREVYFINNTGGQNGGGMHLETSSINLKKTSKNYYDVLKLEFTNNTAMQKGGAIYISDTKEQCDKATSQNTNIKGCFLQVLKAYDLLPFDHELITELHEFSLLCIFFYGNKALIRGGDIYGGLLDRCSALPTSQFLFAYPQYEHADGIQYLQTIARFDNLTFSNLISSDAVRICYCDTQGVYCNHTHPTIEVRKGETFSISVVAVDQTQTPLRATVMSSLSTRNGFIGRISEGQQSQQVSSRCTELTFNVYSFNNSATLQLYAEGPCGNQGISLQEVNITFLPCVPPVGFQRSAFLIKCSFECDHRILPYVSNCSVKDETVQMEKNVWIEHVNTSNCTGYLIQDCPYDYCVNKPVNITLSTREGTDKLCAFNRTGKLCGQCAEGLSLVFASSQCRECTNHWLLLLIPFALAGVLLVAIVLLLHKAVDNGALHGLLFYANILAANQSIFYPSQEPTILNVFVSWLNLDLGIETCFYNGMTSTTKVLLQLTFPLYIFALMGAIIILVKVSDSKTSKVSGLLSKGKPVEGLCMLILLSYSKLLRTVIVSLQFTTLNYPDGTREIVWLFDANIQYFSKDHIPLFILGMVIIIIGGVYTGLLLFGQYLTKRLTNPRYKTIIEAHYRPFIERYRYWIGLLLLARIIHYLVSALSADSATILSAGGVTIGLLCFKLSHALNNRQLRINEEIGYLATYKNVVIEAIEAFCLINMVVSSLGTLYERTVGWRTQSILANSSMAFAFLTFMAILICSIALNIRSKEFYYQKCKATVEHLKNCCKQSQNVSRYHQLQDFADPLIQEEMDYPDLQDHQPYTGPTQADTTSSREDPPQQRGYDPPVITLCSPAVTSTELREELLADTEEGDVQVQYYTPRARPACTHQEIDLNVILN